MAKEKNVKLFVEVESGFQCFVDEALLFRALKNVIENGIRYNLPGGYVKVSCFEEGEWAVVKVEDNGIGIPAEEQNAIFEIFSRGLPSTKTSQRGNWPWLGYQPPYSRVAWGENRGAKQSQCGNLFQNSPSFDLTEI